MGHHVQGKLETIRETANLLLAAFTNHTLHAINIGADITYVVDIDGIKIGIESQGDPDKSQTQLNQIAASETLELIKLIMNGQL